MSGAVVVIGNFDGVHPGHQEVLRRAREIDAGSEVVVLTFWPHPVAVLRPDRGPMLLTSLSERIRLLKEAGASDVRVIEFTPELAASSPAEFVERHLEPLNPRHVVVGENFHFGHRASGDINTLRSLARGRFEVTGLELVHAGPERTSSTRIREALKVGDVRRAAEHLGRPFRFGGIVRHGDHRGRELGFPTANLAVPDLLACPSDGVYAGWVTRLDGLDAHGEPLSEAEAPARWPAAISVGSNPTFDGVDRRVEAYCLDRTDLELYGALIAVDFCERIRGQIRFTGVDALIAQMDSDVALCREILARRS